MSEKCAICGAEIPESDQAPWVKKDRFCWGCRSYICSPCILKNVVVPSGPHDVSWHNDTANLESPPWPPQAA